MKIFQLQFTCCEGCGGNVILGQLYVLLHLVVSVYVQNKSFSSPTQSARCFKKLKNSVRCFRRYDQMDFVTVKATAICGREQQQDENLMKNI